MTDNHSELLSQAIAGLHLRDIVLFSSRFERPTPPPESPDVEVLVQTKRQVRFERGETSEAGNVQQHLQVVVELGLRVVKNTDPDATVYFEIEADFLAEYEVRNEIAEDAVRVFSELNSVHNVWPFWRQHVFDVVQRGRLPHVEVPLFAVQQTKREQAAVKTDE